MGYFRSVAVDLDGTLAQDDRLAIARPGEKNANLLPERAKASTGIRRYAAGA